MLFTVNIESLGFRQFIGQMKDFKDGSKKLWWEMFAAKFDILQTKSSAFWSIKKTLKRLENIYTEVTNPDVRKIYFVYCLLLHRGQSSRSAPHHGWLVKGWTVDLCLQHCPQFLLRHSFNTNQNSSRWPPALQVLGIVVAFNLIVPGSAVVAVADSRQEKNQLWKGNFFFPFYVKKTKTKQTNKKKTRTVRPLMYNAGNSNSTVRQG